MRIFVMRVLTWSSTNHIFVSFEGTNNTHRFNFDEDCTRDYHVQLNTRTEADLQRWYCYRSEIRNKYDLWNLQRLILCCTLKTYDCFGDRNTTRNIFLLFTTWPTNFIFKCCVIRVHFRAYPGKVLHYHYEDFRDNGYGLLSLQDEAYDDARQQFIISRDGRYITSAIEGHRLELQMGHTFNG